MIKKPIEFSDLATGNEGDAAKDAFVALADQLIADGHRPDRVFRAMLRGAYAASIARSTAEHYAFVADAAIDTANWKMQIERFIDADLDRPEVKAFLDEIGFDDAVKEAEEASRI